MLCPVMPVVQKHLPTTVVLNIWAWTMVHTKQTTHVQRTPYTETLRECARAAINAGAASARRPLTRSFLRFTPCTPARTTHATNKQSSSSTATAEHMDIISIFHTHHDDGGVVPCWYPLTASSARCASYSMNACLCIQYKHTCTHVTYTYTHARTNPHKINTHLQYMHNCVSCGPLLTKHSPPSRNSSATET